MNEFTEMGFYGISFYTPRSIEINDFLKLDKLLLSKFSAEYSDTQPIDWVDDYKNILSDYFNRNLIRPFYLNSVLGLPKPLRNGIFNFLIALEVNERDPNKIYLSSFYVSNLINRGNKCAKWLKELRTQCILKSFNAQTLNYEEHEDIKKYVKPLKDVSSILHYKHLPFFKEECEDIKYMSIPCERSDGIEIFRTAVRKILEDLPDLDEIPFDEIRYEFSSSSSYNSKAKKNFSLLEVK